MLLMLMLAVDAWVPLDSSTISVSSSAFGTPGLGPVCDVAVTASDQRYRGSGTRRPRIMLGVVAVPMVAPTYSIGDRPDGRP